MPKLSSITVAVLLIGLLMLTACASQSPTQAPAPTQPPAQPPVQPPATLPPVKETVIVKETITVKETVIIQPTGAPSATPTTTATPTRAPAPAAVPKPTSAGKLEFTVDFAPSAPRKGDNKVQVTVILHITGGVAPFQAKEEGIAQTVSKRTDGIEYVRDWQNCGFDQPVTIVVTSADGQTATVKTVVPYATYTCP